MSTQHTPGPWQAGASLISTLTMREIALVSEPRRHKDGSTWTRNGAAETMAEYEANVALIAAAPDLLAVMGAALSTLQACLPHLKGNQEAMVKVQILACSTAIAKAKGRS